MDFRSQKTHCKILASNVTVVGFEKRRVGPPTPNAPTVLESGFPAAGDGEM